MNEIKNVLICGLGALGCFCASRIFNEKNINLKILADESRFKKYNETPAIFNGTEYRFDYILPSNNTFKADLVIIATKSSNLNSAINNVKNFVKEDTIFMSLLNGVYSEEILAQVFPRKNILISFYIGASCIRNGRNVTQKGAYKIQLGSFEKNSNNLKLAANLFNKTKIKYNIPDNIQKEYWQKFIINSGINQLSAASGKTLNQIKQDEYLIQRLKNLMFEAALAAKCSGIKEYEEIYNSAVKFLLDYKEDVTTSMLQDIMNKRKTEADIFSGVILKICSKNNIKTPENEKIYQEIKNIEKTF